MLLSIKNSFTERRYDATTLRVFLLVFQTINHTLKTMLNKVLSEIDQKPHEPGG
jgi:hypothetical protein